MKITKKAFEELINETESVISEKKGVLTGATVRPYGTYIRSADPEMFNISYKRYIETGVYRISLWDEE